MKKLEQLGTEYDVIVQEMLTNGIEPLEKQIKSNLEAIVGRGTKYKSRSKGDLVKAVKVTKVYQVANGDWHIKVGIYGYDSDGVPNALKAMVLEHGRSSNKNGNASIPPKPWLKPAISATKKQCVQAMVDTFDKKVNKS